MADAGFDLSGRRAMVTGGSTGIGAAVAERLAAAGARVVAVSRSGGAPDIAGVEPLVCDLGDPDQGDAVVDRAAESLGGLDILVNNAGGAEWRAVAELDRRYFDSLVSLNLWAPLRLCQLAHRYLAAGQSPSVVMVGSIDSVRPSPGGAVYGATKAALGAAVVALAKEWMADGIRVNQVDPGLVDTPLAADAVAAVRDADARINAVGRVGSPEEIAGLVHYLVAPVGGFANGACFTVDGGALTLGPFDGLAADPGT